MTTRGIRPGDIVRADIKGRVFYAMVRRPADAGLLAIRPLDTRITYTSVKARQVVGHWRRSADTPAPGARGA